jgi:hypothetical protein
MTFSWRQIDNKNATLFQRVKKKQQKYFNSTLCQVPPACAPEIFMTFKKKFKKSFKKKKKFKKFRG